MQRVKAVQRRRDDLADWLKGYAEAGEVVKEQYKEMFRVKYGQLERCEMMIADKNILR